jgi:hypothetical protein
MIKVAHNVLIQHAKFFLITRIRVKSTYVWLKITKTATTKNKELSMTLLPVNLKFMCIMMCLVIFLNTYITSVLCNRLLFRPGYDLHTCVLNLQVFVLNLHVCVLNRHAVCICYNAAQIIDSTRIRVIVFKTDAGICLVPEALVYIVIK